MSHSAIINRPTLPDGLLLEGIVTTLDEDGSLHVAPMGPIVDYAFSRLVLRPYRTSTTYRNLKRSNEGVLHVTDDVELFARAAVGELLTEPPSFAAKAICGRVLANVCRWYEFRVESLNDSVERTEILASVVERGSLRDFFGFNRAKHAVIEAAILASRTKWLATEFVRSEFQRLAVIVEKTGGRQEHAAFEFLRAYLAAQSERASMETPG